MLNNPTERGDGRKADGLRVVREQGGDRLVDREVPLGQFQMPQAIHAWLDGEGSEASARASTDGASVEFWSLMRAETDQRRAVKAPVSLQPRIMVELARTQPAAVIAWHQRPIELNWFVVLTTATGLLALGAAIGVTVSR